MTDPQLYVIASDRVADIWRHVEGLLRPAMERCGEMHMIDLYQKLVDGKFYLWLAIGDNVEAAAVTEIAETTAGRVLCIVACGGIKRDRWLHFMQQIEEYGRRAGCVLTRIYGRRGWQRALPDYHVSRLVLEKEL